MDVVQLFLAFLRGPQDEGIEAWLPDVIFAVALEAPLGGHMGPEPFQYAPSKALFDGLHHRGRIASSRLAEQQMDMLRHDDVAHHNEMIAAAHMFQHFKKQVASGGGLEQRATLVATGGDVVQVALTIAAIEIRHAGVLSRTWARRCDG